MDGDAGGRREAPGSDDVAMELVGLVEVGRINQALSAAAVVPARISHTTGRRLSFSFSRECSAMQSQLSKAPSATQSKSAPSSALESALVPSDGMRTVLWLAGTSEVNGDSVLSGSLSVRSR